MLRFCLCATHPTLEWEQCSLTQLDGNGRERPIAFWSAAFKASEKFYTTTEKECLAVVASALAFTGYIHGQPTVVVTDHSALTWILSHRDPPARAARWVMTLMNYDFTVVHRKGKFNVVADAESKQHHKWRTFQLQDEFCSRMINYLKREELPSNVNQPELIQAFVWDSGGRECILTFKIMSQPVSHVKQQENLRWSRQP
jgi:hypothetical protein